MMRPPSASRRGPPLARRSAILPAFSGVVMVMALTGCDNVSWGGVQWTLESSALAAGEVDEEQEEVAAAAPEAADGPILYLVQRDLEGSNGTASAIPLAVIAGDSLLPVVDEEGAPGFPTDFETEELSEGSTFTLFSDGARVGSFRTGSGITLDSTYCFARPRADGMVELVPEAVEARTFLALRDEQGASVPYGDFRPLQSSYDQRVATLDIAGDLIPSLSAPWPRSILDARRDLRVFALDGEDTGAMAVTFMYEDALAVGPAAENAYALFFIAENSGGGYAPGYVWFRQAASGKAAPRYLSHFDWNLDGSDGVVLEIQGAENRWFAAAGRRMGAWQTLFEDPCGQAASAGRAGPPD